MNATDNRVIIIVLDGCGCGAMPDAAEYGDEGSNTLGNLSSAISSLRLPNLCRLGLAWIVPFMPVDTLEKVYGAYGKVRAVGKAKDTLSGHWEMAGVIQDPPFKTYPKGFPDELVQEWRNRCNLGGILGNYPASGTAIIEELGEDHMRTGWPILYTSADSVFQVAAHENVVQVAKLYEICMTARELLAPPHLVARVIARPFSGQPGSFRRTGNRRDFAVPAPGPTLLEYLQEKGMPVLAIGKIDEIFSKRGITHSDHTTNNSETIHKTLERIMNGPKSGLVFANLGDFDTLYGHRRNICGYAEALNQFDDALAEILKDLREKDVLIITSDHGCDPTFQQHTDHTREEVPLLVAGGVIRKGYNIGLRTSLADISATVCDALGLDKVGEGNSFWREVNEL